MGKDSCCGVVKGSSAFPYPRGSWSGGEGLDSWAAGDQEDFWTSSWAEDSSKDDEGQDFWGGGGEAGCGKILVMESPGGSSRAWDSGRVCGVEDSCWRTYGCEDCGNIA